MSLVKVFDLKHVDIDIDEACFGDKDNDLTELYLTISDYRVLDGPSKIKVTVEEVVDV